MEHSKKSLEYLDPQTNEKYIPYVIEPSVGADRLFLSILCDSYQEETLENGDTRTVMKLHPAVAPYKVAVLPLTKNKVKKLKKFMQHLLNISLLNLMLQVKLVKDIVVKMLLEHHIV